MARSRPWRVSERTAGVVAPIAEPTSWSRAVHPISRGASRRPRRSEPRVVVVVVLVVVREPRRGRWFASRSGSLLLGLAAVPEREDLREREERQDRVAASFCRPDPVRRRRRLELEPMAPDLPVRGRHVPDRRLL